MATIIRCTVLISAIANAFVALGAQPDAKSTSALQVGPAETTTRFFASLASEDVDKEGEKGTF
ncbi:MAG: hypothetical protein WD669_06175 [Pirellulales bacterium]